MNTSAIPASITEFIEEIVGPLTIKMTNNHRVMNDGKLVSVEMGKETTNIDITVKDTDSLVAQLLDIKAQVSIAAERLKLLFGSNLSTGYRQYYKGDKQIISVIDCVDIFIKYLNAIEIPNPLLLDVVRISTGIDAIKILTGNTDTNHITDIAMKKVGEKYVVDIPKEICLINEIIRNQRVCLNKLTIIKSKLPAAADIQIPDIYKVYGNTDENIDLNITHVNLEIASLASPQYLAYLIVNGISYSYAIDYKADPILSLLLERSKSKRHAEHICKLTDIRDQLNKQLDNLNKKIETIIKCETDILNN